jgi:hypothetical protein
MVGVFLVLVLFGLADEGSDDVFAAEEDVDEKLVDLELATIAGYLLGNVLDELVLGAGQGLPAGLVHVQLLQDEVAVVLVAEGEREDAGPLLDLDGHGLLLCVGREVPIFSTLVMQLSLMR